MLIKKYTDAIEFVNAKYTEAIRYMDLLICRAPQSQNTAQAANTFMLLEKFIEISRNQFCVFKNTNKNIDEISECVEEIKALAEDEFKEYL